MSRSKRVALSQRVVHIGNRDETRDELDQRWPALLEALGYIPIAVPNLLHNVDQWLKELEISMIILTGGNDLHHLEGATDASQHRDETEARMIGYAVTHELPLLGVCRGMQMMVCHFGGALVQRVGHVATTHPITPLSSTINLPLRSGPVNSFHNWVVESSGVPPHFEILATSDDGAVEAIRHTTLPHAGVMWHPERPPYDDVDMRLVEVLHEQGTK